MLRAIENKIALNPGGKPMKKQYLKLSPLFVSASVIALAAPAVAQTDDGLSLDTITVTAQKRSENQQSVPIAVTTANEKFLDENDVRTLEDLAVPGFLTTNTVNYGAAPLSIRGIGGANGGGNFFNDEPVAVYVDGVYIGRLSFSTADLQDVESIQVLRGPQGTLYGRNSTAGAVLVTTKRPTDEFEGELRAGYSRFNEFRVGGVVSGPITESLSARAAIGYSDRSGFGTNIFDGSDIGGSEDFTARLSLNFSPNDSLSFDLIGEYQDRTANPALIAVTGVGGVGVGSPFVERPDLDDVLDRNEFNVNDPNTTDTETFSISLLGDIDLGFATLNTVSSYRDYTLDGAQDSDSTGLQLFNNNGNLASQQFSQEVRFTSNGDGPFSWIIGGYFFDESSDLFFDIRNFQGLFRLGTEAIFDATQDTSAYAVFGDATYDITDRLSLTFGARYSYEEKDFVNDQTVLILNGGTIPPIPPAGPLGGLTFAPGAVFANPPEFAASEDFNDFSPRVVVDFQATDDLFLYASYSQGFKSGGFNSFGLAPAFDSEDINAYEIGFKSDFADSRIRLNASGFFYDYSNLQIRLPVPTGGVDIQNVAAAEISGFEVETSALVMEGFTVSASIAYLDTEITEGLIPAISSATPAFPIGIPLPLAPEDVSGNELTRAPKVQAFVNATYERPVGPLVAALSATYKFQDGVFFLETNQDTSTFSNDDWRELDLRLSISDPDSKWELAAFGQNITNNRRLTAVTALGGFPNAALNEPAKWGIEAVIRY